MTSETLSDIATGVWNDMDWVGLKSRKLYTGVYRISRGGVLRMML